MRPHRAGLSRQNARKFLFSALLALAILPGACRSTPELNGIIVRQPQRVSQVPFAIEPHIAADPTNPDRLAAVIISASEYECDRETCRRELVLYTSSDGGRSWALLRPFERAVTGADGVVGFDSEGRLHVVGLLGLRAGPGGVVAVNRADAAGQMQPDTVKVVSRRLGNDKPWLTVDQRRGAAYVVYSGPSDESLTYFGVLFHRSTDGGETWSDPVVVDRGVERRVPAGAPVMNPLSAQVMIGEGQNLAVTWVWSPVDEAELALGEWHNPFGVWVATSIDGGQTFSAPRQIAEARSNLISSTFHDGTYYVVYRRGSLERQELAVAISSDGGTTWASTPVSGDVPLYFDVDKAPGVHVAPNGTIDVVFYAHGQDAPECISMEALEKRWEEGWVDQCSYDVYYTFSKDGGQTFSQAVKLNDRPIEGERFVLRLGLMSWPADYIGMASTDSYAHPIWIATEGTEGTQTYMTRISR